MKVNTRANEYSSGVNEHSSGADELSGADQQAGASSMWASCCGLLNEVMGTGTMRPPGGQTGFGPGARPFRFAPSAGYSTYPPATPSSSGSAHNNASVSAGLACKACGLAFSVFRRKYVCSDCRKSYCSLCSVLQENLRRCATCHLLWGTAFQRPRLMRLRVKDLRQYLMLRNIPTDTCREKEDLVELVMCTLGPRPPRIGEEVVQEEVEEEEEEAREEEAREEAVVVGEEERPGVVLSPPQGSAPRSVSEHSELSITTSQDDTLSSSSGTSSQDQADAASLATLNLEDSSSIQEASPGTQRRARASLSDISTEDAIESLTVRQLKEILARNFVNFSGCCEKWELVERVHRLYRDNEQNRRSMENVNSDITAVTTYPPPICLGELGGKDVTQSREP
ncbi:E3 ubiquitin-protein ligase RNF34 [Alosa alosa]|uniref:E3 ubiquitin-protein ligase RNF34 n=1 Tax=Alosa alosa TaxID=278164 RepID=UPI0020154E97|nr:E3 ubiquitin-protein ligase RNF34 [Alosa alosa]